MMSLFRVCSPCMYLIKLCAGKEVLMSHLLFFQFSPPVKEALKSGHLTGNIRDEFTRNICSAMRVHTLYPTHTEKDRVSMMILEKYPFLEDTLGAGLLSGIYSSLQPVPL